MKNNELPKVQRCQGRHHFNNLAEGVDTVFSISNSGLISCRKLKIVRRRKNHCVMLGADLLNKYRQMLNKPAQNMLFQGLLFNK
jgi:hypothetical protein